MNKNETQATTAMQEEAQPKPKKTPKRKKIKKPKPAPDFLGDATIQEKLTEEQLQVVKAWNGHKNSGSKPKYQTEEQLINKFIEYMTFVDDHPWQTDARYTQRQKGRRVIGENENIVYIRNPYTLTAFGIFACILDWSSFKKYNTHFADAIRFIEETIKANQINGAMIGEYKEAFVARLNGLADKTEVQATINDEQQSHEDLQAEFERLKTFFDNDKLTPSEE